MKRKNKFIFVGLMCCLLANSACAFPPNNEKAKEYYTCKYPGFVSGEVELNLIVYDKKVVVKTSSGRASNYLVLVDNEVGLVIAEGLAVLSPENNKPEVGMRGISLNKITMEMLKGSIILDNENDKTFRKGTCIQQK